MTVPLRRALLAGAETPVGALDYAETLYDKSRRRAIWEAMRETRDAMGFRALDNLDAIMAGREPGDRLV